MPGFALIDRTGHRVDQLFYADDGAFLRDVADHLATATERGGTGVAFVTAEHERALRQALEVRTEGDGLSGLRFFPAEETLGQLLVDDRLEGARFFEVIGAVLDSAAAPVHVYAEMAGVFWEAGELSAVAELENLWRKMQLERDFSLLTGYSPAPTDGERPSALEEVLGVHASLLGIDGSAPELRRARKARTRAFAPEAAAPAQVRGFVRQVLGNWGCGGVDEAVLVASELSTNAVVHAGSFFSVVIARLEDGVRVSVRDGAPFSDETEPSVDMVHGLGIVSRLSASWGIERHEQGKTVWSELIES